MTISNSIRRLTLENEKAESVFSVYSPNDNSLISEVELPSQIQINKAINEISDKFRIFSKTDSYKISLILNKVADLINQNSEYLSLLIATEGGKPLKDAKVEVQRSENTIRECANEALNLKGEIIEMDKSPRGANKIAYTKLYPIGPVLAISAFNHPLNLLCHQIGTAIAAKCTIIIKPAPNTCLSAYELYNYFIKAGLEYGVLHILPLDAESTSKLINDKRFKYISFIGSEKVGWNIWKNIYPGTRVQFEHGGTGTAVVLNDADLDKSVKSLISSSFYHSGQVCVSTQNLYVEKDIYETFKSKFIENATLLTIGDARDLSTDCGPIIKKEACYRIEEWVNQAIDQGAKNLIGGKRISDNYYQVTVLENVKSGMKVFDEEIFGPIVNLIPFNSLEDVISQINSSEYAFQTCIFTKDMNKAFYYADNIEQKACMINENNAFRVDWMPFGGYKKSGFGTGGVKYSIKDMSLEKLIVINNS